MANRFRFCQVLRESPAFTLLEVMIAVSIIAVALVALFGSQSRSLSIATEAQFNILAPALAAMKLAELESGIIDLENDDGDFGEEFPGYIWTIEAEDAVFDQPDGLINLTRPLRKIDLKVSWNETNYSYLLTYYGRAVK